MFKQLTLGFALALATTACGADSPPEVAQSQAIAVANLLPGGAAGQKAPSFTLRDHNGADVSLSNLLASGPVVLFFYRGYW